VAKHFCEKPVQPGQERTYACENTENVDAYLRKTLAPLCTVREAQLELECQRPLGALAKALSPEDRQSHRLDTYCFARTYGLALGSGPDQAWLFMAPLECVRSFGLKPST
jgi:hypothetical protein